MIEVKNIAKTFNNNKIISDLNFNIKDGEVFGLLGPNGSGKTTIIWILLGLYTIDNGEIIKNNNLKLGYSPETPKFPEFLKGKEVLNYYMEIEKIPKEKRSIMIEELFKTVGLNVKKDNYIKYYSKGMLQRLAIAQSLINNPDLLLLDEPTSGLDILGQIEMIDLIEKLKKNGKSIILNSHLLYDVEKVVDRGIILTGKGDYIEFNKDDLSENSLADIFLENVRMEGKYVSNN